MVDEESVGSLDRPGCGAKILRGDGALDHYLSINEEKDALVRHPGSYYSAQAFPKHEALKSLGIIDL